jgi:hypothetical protein
MFKNILIAILTISLLAFSYIAVKNSKPIECDDIVATEKNMLCVIELGDIEEDEVYEALQYKYGKQPLFNE